MSARITEAELRALESTSKLPWAGSVNAFNTSALVAEVRRLRELIVKMDKTIEEASGTSVSRGLRYATVAPGERLLYLAEQTPAFFAEARAIREEQNGVR